MEEVCRSFFHATTRFFSTDSKRQVKACAQIRKRHDIQGFENFLEKQQKSGFSNLSAPFFPFFFLRHNINITFKFYSNSYPYIDYLYVKNTI